MCYNARMKLIRDLIFLEELERLASGSHFRYGEKILRDGEVTIAEDNRIHIVAQVKQIPGENRTVEMWATPKGLKWKCACTARKGLFCKHCVALGLYLINQKINK